MILSAPPNMDCRCCGSNPGSLLLPLGCPSSFPGLAPSGLRASSELSCHSRDARVWRLRWSDFAHRHAWPSSRFFRLPSVRRSSPLDLKEEAKKVSRVPMQPSAQLWRRY